MRLQREVGVPVTGRDPGALLHRRLIVCAICCVVSAVALMAAHLESIDREMEDQRARFHDVLERMDVAPTVLHHDGILTGDGSFGDTARLVVPWVQVRQFFDSVPCSGTSVTGAGTSADPLIFDVRCNK
jgi:hypothetical protein